MSAARLWALPFPAGVADAEATHALVRDAAGRCAALRLADGQLLWCSDAPLVPLLLDRELAVALMLAPPRVVAMALHDGGRPLWTSAPLPWPAWELQQKELAASSELHAAWTGGDVLLQWQLHRPLGAGAARDGDDVLRAHGLCRLERTSGALHPLAPDAAMELPPQPSPALPSGDADVVAQCEVGGMCYRLHARTEGELTTTRLSARPAAAAATTQWSTALGEQPRRRAPPRRP